MIKAIFLLYKRADLTTESFRRHSEDTHIPLVARVPGLRKYVVNHILADPAAGSEACDAIAELWFDSMEAFQRALTTPEGNAALADQANYLNTERTQLLFAEEMAVI